MKIAKMEKMYALTVKDDCTVFFDKYESNSCSVNLWLNGVLVSIIYFEQASEFYRAWRAIQ